MTVRDVDRFELGELLDIITEYNNVIYESENNSESTIKQATQEDFDRF